MCAAEDIVDHPGGAFLLAKAFRKERGRQSDDQRRRDAGGRHTGHKEIVTLPQQQRTGDIGRFVDRPAEVEGAHCADHDPQQDGVGFLQRAEPVHHAIVDRCHWLAEQDHHHANHQDADQRHNEDRLQPFVLARQTVEQMTDQQHKIPGGKTGDDPTEEPGAGGVRQQAADKTGDHARAARYRPGNVGGKHRHHDRERLLTDFHQGGGNHVILR